MQINCLSVSVHLFSWISPILFLLEPKLLVFALDAHTYRCIPHMQLYAPITKLDFAALYYFALCVGIPIFGKCLYMHSFAFIFGTNFAFQFAFVCTSCTAPCSCLLMHLILFGLTLCCIMYMCPNSAEILRTPTSDHTSL